MRERGSRRWQGEFYLGLKGVAGIIPVVLPKSPRGREECTEPLSRKRIREGRKEERKGEVKTLT